MSDLNTNPCLNCGCHENESLVDKWNKRTARLITANIQAFQSDVAQLSWNGRWRVPRDIAERTSTDAVFGFGFDSWVADPFSDLLIGRFRAAIRSRTSPSLYGVDSVYRYYCVVIPAPDPEAAPAPYEHVRGCRHPAPYDHAPGTHHIRQVEEMSDDTFVAWLLPSFRALVAFVVAREAEVLGAT